MRYFLTILTLVVIHVTTQAQLGRSLQACWVHLDKPFYVTEDIIGFQLYLAPEFVDKEMTVQAILFDPDGQAVNYSYWQNQGRAIVTGSIAINSTTSTNWHYISFRVWDQEKQRERVFIQTPIAIYNDQQPIEPAQVSQQEPNRLQAAVELPKKGLKIAFTELPEAAKPGEPTRIALAITDHRGRPVQADYSVSISDWSLLSCSLAMGMDNLYASDSLRVITPSFLSDNLYWKGRLLDEDSEAVADQSLLVKMGDDTQTLQTDSRGILTAISSRKILRDQLAITYPDGRPARTIFQPTKGRLLLGKLFYTPAVFRYLELNRQRREINSLLGLSTMAPLYRQPNSVQFATGTTAFTGYNTDQNHGWFPPASSTGPGAPSLVWQSGLQTSTGGAAIIEYNSSTDQTAYRIDVVAQDAKGSRGRASVIYRIE